MDHKNSQSASYAAAGVDITAGYKAVELMKKHVARTRNEGCLDDVGGFGGCFGLGLAGMEEPVLVSGTDLVEHLRVYRTFYLGFSMPIRGLIQNHTFDCTNYGDQTSIPVTGPAR